MKSIASLSVPEGAQQIIYPTRRANPDGTFYYDWTTPISGTIYLDTGKTVEANGILHVIGNVTKTTSNGLAYLSGSVTDGYVSGNLGFSTQRFIMGRLNIQNNGTRAPAVNPDATIYFEQNLLVIVISGTATLNSNRVVFFVPET